MYHHPNLVGAYRGDCILAGGLEDLSGNGKHMELRAGTAVTYSGGGALFSADTFLAARWPNGHPFSKPHALAGVTVMADVGTGTGTKYYNLGMGCVGAGEEPDYNVTLAWFNNPSYGQYATVSCNGAYPFVSTILTAPAGRRWLSFVVRNQTGFEFEGGLDGHGRWSKAGVLVGDPTLGYRDCAFCMPYGYPVGTASWGGQEYHDGMTVYRAFVFDCPLTWSDVARVKMDLMPIGNYLRAEDQLGAAY